MHPSVEQLLTLRDAPAAGGAVAAHVAGCADCRRELRRLEALPDALRALPDVPPADGVWAALMARTAPRPHWPYAIAAAVLLAGPVTVAVLNAPAPPAPVVTRTHTPTPEPLRARSAQLERALRALPERPRVVDARTAAAIAALESQIAVLDHGLTQVAAGALDATATEALWRDRVGLMESLLSVRYAEAQQAAQ